jgi:Lrp/AsnC family transcriptional regulator, regulator for asnA, asnC and gidA
MASSRTRTAGNGQDRRRPDVAVLDDADKALIEHLQRDGRTPYTRLAEAVGLSEAAVRQRVQRLIDNNVVQIVAVTDPLRLGFRRQAMIGIRTEGDITAVADTLAAMSEIDYLVYTSGRFDLLAEMVCEDDEHLLNVLNEQIRNIPGVSSTETFVYLRLQKQTYTWGAR